MDNAKEKTVYILLGNGASIQTIKDLGMEDRVDLRNLFSQCDRVPWPQNQHECFLSQKHCQELWSMGVKATNNTRGASNLINNIITSMNVYNYCVSNSSRTLDSLRIDKLKESFYYKAYCQLVSYFLNLFIYYNNQIDDSMLLRYVTECKCGNIYDFIDVKSKEGYRIRIISYNYDIFLERILKLKKLLFKVAGFDEISENDKIIIYKPHGSISFISKEKRKSPHYSVIKDPFDSVTHDIKSMEIDMSIKADHSIINPIVPPAGDANRSGDGWLTDIGKSIKEVLSAATSEDTLLIYGISYDHVDRLEIDKIISSLPYDMDVNYINPYPTETFEIVLASVFANYSHYKFFYKELYL